MRPDGGWRRGPMARSSGGQQYRTGQAARRPIGQAAGTGEPKDGEPLDRLCHRFPAATPPIAAASRSASRQPSAPAIDSSISDEGSLRPRSTSDRYCADSPARSATCRSVRPDARRRSRSAAPATSRQSGSGGAGTGVGSCGRRDGTRGITVRSGSGVIPSSLGTAGRPDEVGRVTFRRGLTHRGRGGECGDQPPTGNSPPAYQSSNSSRLAEFTSSTITPLAIRW